MARILKLAFVVSFLGSSVAWLAAYSKGELFSVPVIAIPSEEVVDLRALARLLQPGDIVATTRHTVAQDDSRHHANNAYYQRAIVGHPVLLEGSLYQERFHPAFGATQRLNEEIFSTNNADQLRRLLQRHKVAALLVHPNDRLGLDSIPSWLVPVAGTSSIRVYIVRNGDSPEGRK